jgi:hypothetical protein
MRTTPEVVVTTPASRAHQTRRAQDDRVGERDRRRRLPPPAPDRAVAADPHGCGDGGGAVTGAAASVRRADPAITRSKWWTGRGSSSSIVPRSSRN